MNPWAWFVLSVAALTVGLLIFAFRLAWDAWKLPPSDDEWLAEGDPRRLGYGHGHD